MLNYETIKTNPSQFLALTSLQVNEFDYLSEHFAPYWEKYYRYNTLQGKCRKHPAYEEHENGCLQGSTNKLFFLIVYLKTYPLQQYHSAQFGITQGKTSQLIKVLKPILSKTLKAMGCMPSSNPEEIHNMLEAMQITAVIIDATERLVPRATDYGVQEEFFSGKKKEHTVKNNILAADWQEVLYLSPTHEGKKHDKKICDEEGYEFPEGIILRQDNGYKGYQPRGVVIEQPYKSSKKHPLTEDQKLHNKFFSAKRVVVEHVMMGCKRLRIVKDQLRNFCWETIDTTMEIACALHNFRVRSPLRAYAHTPARIKFKFYS